MYSVFPLEQASLAIALYQDLSRACCLGIQSNYYNAYIGSIRQKCSEFKVFRTFGSHCGMERATFRDNIIQWKGVEDIWFGLAQKLAAIARPPSVEKAS